MNEEGSDVDAIATVEAARVSLSNTKTELTNGLTTLDAERERFKAVVETSILRNQTRFNAEKK